MLQSRIDGGSSSVAERLTVAQDVVGSIPTRRPKIFTDRTGTKPYLLMYGGFRDPEDP